MNKNLIKQRFKKNLDSYEVNAHIQEKMAKRLLTFLSNTEFKNILEIGCGCGLLTKLVNEQLNFENYYTNDIVEDCEKYIKEINESITFISGDIEQVIKKIQKNMI